MNRLRQLLAQLAPRTASQLNLVLGVRVSAKTMKVETITESDELVIRRLELDPGEPMYWHKDTCRRFTVVIRGSRLAIEYFDSKEVFEFDVHAGMADWDEPDNRTHRAINVGAVPYEEVVTFYRNSADTDPQPRQET